MALIAYCSYDANAMDEYGAIFFTITCVIKALIDYFVAVWKARDILEMIENCEGFVENSKSAVANCLRVIFLPEF